jgi:hypothetical protein
MSRFNLRQYDMVFPYFAPIFRLCLRNAARRRDMNATWSVEMSRPKSVLPFTFIEGEPHHRGRNFPQTPNDFMSLPGEGDHPGDIVEKGEPQIKIRNWKRVEKECGCRLSEDVREQLQGACSRFLLCAHPEKQGGPPLADALTRIDEIRRTAQEFRAKPSGLHKDAVSLAETLVDIRLAALNFPGLAGLMSLVVRACDDGKAELIDHGRKRPKEAFPRFIREVTDICYRAGLPTEAGRKGTGPFTTLVWEIQRQFPEGYAEHMESHEALGQAINRAR